MANHIFGYEKKITSASTGTLYDSGGPSGVYNANEFDYFIIRRTADDYGANNRILFEITEWSVADYSVSTTDYDYIDVYKSDDGYDPSNWTWVDRLGGSDINSGAGLPAHTSPGEFHVVTRHLKFVFRSSFRQNYTYSGFKISWQSANAALGTVDLDGVAATTYTDEQNLKENAMDSEDTVDTYVERDPAKTNWDFIPEGQFNESSGITVLNHRFTDMDYAKPADVSVPLSYTSPERQHHAINVGNISIED
jgi:hypothetical protein